MPQDLLPMDISGQPADVRARLKLGARGLNMTKVAAKMGCHRTFPGKMLRGQEAMTAKRRAQLIAAGVDPEELPPESSPGDG